MNDKLPKKKNPKNNSIKKSMQFLKIRFYMINSEFLIFELWKLSHKDYITLGDRNI